MSSFRVYIMFVVLDWCKVRGGCIRWQSPRSAFRTLPHIQILLICGFQFRKLTALEICYFFFGFRACESGLFNYFGCKFSASGSVSELVAFCESSLSNIDITLPRYLPLIYLFTVVPCLFFSSMIVSSESLMKYLELGCVRPYEFNYLTIKYRY